MISMMTKQIIKTLQYNPSYDLVNDVNTNGILISNQISNMTNDPATFLNQFLSLRLHPLTRDAIESSIRRFKPLSDEFLYGLILTDRTIVGLIKNDG